MKTTTTTTTLTIKQTYHDALFYASSQQNKPAPETGINKKGNPKKKVDKSFFLTSNELKVLMKLIHYSTANDNITYQDKDISNHTWIPVPSIINTIKSLKDKGYIINNTNNLNDGKNWYAKRIININWNFIESVYKLSQANKIDVINDKPQPEIIPIEVEINNAADAIVLTNNTIDYQEDIIVPQIDCDGVILSERTSESITELIDLFNNNDYIMLSSIQYPVISIFKGKTNSITDKISKEINSKAKEFQDGTLDIKEYILDKIKEVA